MFTVTVTVTFTVTVTVRVTVRVRVTFTVTVTVTATVTVRPSLRCCYFFKYHSTVLFVQLRTSLRVASLGSVGRFVLYEG